MNENRIHYLDNLRAIAMMLGVFLHAGFAYAKPSNVIWLATDNQSSTAVDCAIWFIHLFRMGLFFLLSGYFSKLIFEKRGWSGLLWNRLIRIAVPFVLFYPVLLVAIIGVFIFAISYLENPSGIMGLVAAGEEVESTEPKKSIFTLMHLWFLYYLFFISILGALLGSKLDQTIPSLARTLRLDRLSLARSQWIVFAVLPLLFVPAVMMAGVPVPAPESFIPSVWPFLFFGGFFFSGWLIRGREHMIDMEARHIWGLVLLMVAAFVVYYASMPVVDLRILFGGQFDQSTLQYWLGILLTCYLAVGLCWLSLVLGKEFLNSRSSFMGIVSDSSYWVYLVHLPLAVYLQTLLVPLDWSIWVKLFLSTAGTLVPCLFTYLVFVRYTPLGRLLHGKRSFP